MAESLSLEQQCVAAFKKGDYDEVLQLLPQLQQPGDVTTEHKLAISPKLSSDVTLVHLAAYHGWLDIIKRIYTIKCNVKDSISQTLLHYAVTGNKLSVVKYLIKELKCDPLTPDTAGNLPLHIACLKGYLNVAKFLITENNCSLTIRGKHGFTHLHYASEGGHIDIIRYLITIHAYDPTIPDSNYNLPLHIACLSGHFNVTKYFINELNCDPSIQNIHGWTPLHCASRCGQMNIIQYLILDLVCDCTITNSYGSLPLHIACLNGNLDVIKYLISEQKCDPNSRNHNGATPLHYASERGHINIINYIMTELCCCATLPDNNGNIPLHIACLNGHLHAAKYFITEQNCDQNSRNEKGSTPLHLAAQGGHLEVIKFLIIEVGCSPSVIDSSGKTVLHLASYYGHSHIVKWLLHNGQVDIMAEDKLGKTCIDQLWDNIENRSELLILFLKFVISMQNSPIRKLSKIVLTGNSSAGKTTLAKVIAKRAKAYFNRLRFGNVQQVEACTAGIVPSLVMSREVGNMIVYDLAGQAEYHSSHSAVMEVVMQQSPATFIHVSDLSQTGDEITRQFSYWLNFIDNVTCKTNIKSCLIVAGSHSDLLSKKELERKLVLFRNFELWCPKTLVFMGAVALDCRKIDSAGTREFISLLLKSHQDTVARAPMISYYCHLLYTFLKSRSEFSVCTFQELNSALSDDTSFIPSRISFLSELLVSLSNRGIILFLKNKQQIEKSWIIVDIASVLKSINEIIFSRKDKHQQIVGNTGIIRLSYLKHLFPQYDLEMLISFLQILEICHCVNLSGITTNLLSIEISSSPEDVEDCFLFFPCLLSTHKDVLPHTSFTFGWCLCCKNQEHHFFTSRFLHVLLLHLAFSFSLADDHTIFSHQIEGRHTCNVWMNGITWDNNEGVRTVVEVIDNRSVVLLMSYGTYSRPMECSKLRSAVIRLILDLQQKFCPNVEVNESLIGYSLLDNWPSISVHPEDNELFSIKNVADSMLLHNPYILNCSYKRCEQFCTEIVLESEPYFQLSPSFVCELMDSSKDNEVVSDTLLYEVQKICPMHHQLESCTYLTLRRLADSFSLFAGRNPIVIANLEGKFPIKEVPAILLVEAANLKPNIDLSLLPDGQLTDFHLSLLMVSLRPIVKWFNLGVNLGLKHATLKTIEIEYRERVEDCKREMLIAWLQNTGNATKIELMSALSMSCL